MLEMQMGDDAEMQDPLMAELEAFDEQDRSAAVEANAQGVPEIAGTPEDLRLLEEAITGFLGLVGGGELDEPEGLVAGGALSPEGKAILAGIAQQVAGSPYALDLKAGAVAIADQLFAAMEDTAFVNSLMGEAAPRFSEES
jgi:hypothetical protein